MKLFITFCLALLAATATALPQCTPNETDGYENCKHVYQVNGSGSDLLYCESKEDCLMVFPPWTPSDSEDASNEDDDDDDDDDDDTVEQNISAIEEAIVSAAPSASVVASAVVASSFLAAVMC
ncbi:unnamed protein product [Pseudo-nitzschia multistriata]|uniref:Uncharacterized protein n=1 Tax=Pseudo-nitzschia multistriata TaxID=183589 RepID=A0A448Z387_9STRA|nr:unnamed protein product [Pseudo-nitzschia multistriata]